LGLNFKNDGKFLIFLVLFILIYFLPYPSKYSCPLTWDGWW